MSSLMIRDMQKEDEYFVGTCTHTNESAILDEYAKRRISWLRNRFDDGARVKGALRDGPRKGFLYVMPIEVCPTDVNGNKVQWNFESPKDPIRAAILEAQDKSLGHEKQ
jgi:hypothetical protein